MPLLRWSRSLLALGLVLAGCKSNPPAATPDAGIAAAPVQDKAPSPAPAPVPLSGPALSYLKVITVLGGAHSAHVYDTRTKKLLASALDVELATLWPEPSRP